MFNVSYTFNTTYKIRCGNCITTFNVSYTFNTTCKIQCGNRIVVNFTSHME